MAKNKLQKKAQSSVLGPQSSALDPQSSVLSPQSSVLSPQSSKKGFTLIELIMIMVIIGLLGTVAVVKWPKGMKDEASAQEFKQAVRYAQHLALTRNYNNNPWGIITSANKYTIQRASGTPKGEIPGADDDPDGSRNYLLLNRASVTSGSVYFNGYGEPILSSGLAHNDTIYFSVGSMQVKIFPQTGYVE